MELPAEHGRKQKKNLLSFYLLFTIVLAMSLMFILKLSDVLAIIAILIGILTSSPFLIIVTTYTDIKEGRVRLEYEIKECEIKEQNNLEIDLLNNLKDDLGDTRNSFIYCMRSYSIFLIGFVGTIIFLWLAVPNFWSFNTIGAALSLIVMGIFIHYTIRDWKRIRGVHQVLIEGIDKKHRNPSFLEVVKKQYKKKL